MLPRYGLDATSFTKAESFYCQQASWAGDRCSFIGDVRYWLSETKYKIFTQPRGDQQPVESVICDEIYQWSKDYSEKIVKKKVLPEFGFFLKIYVKCSELGLGPSFLVSVNVDIFWSWFLAIKWPWCNQYSQSEQFGSTPSASPPSPPSQHFSAPSANPAHPKTPR